VLEAPEALVGSRTASRSLRWLSAGSEPGRSPSDTLRQVQLATATSPFSLLAAFGTVTVGERPDAKTRVRGINLAAGDGAWAIGFQAWEGTWENSAATTKPWWDASSFGFTGREHDLDSAMVYARARYLNPGTGRWDRADPLGMIDGPNRYQYVRGKPTIANDPRGLFLPGIHEQVTRQAFSGVLSGPDLEAVVQGAVEADDTAFQFFDYRHGMRASGTTLEQGAKLWADFIDDEVAWAVDILNGNCGLGLTDAGYRHLGYGAHALEDYYSPPHHMQVMSWLNIVGHLLAERDIAIESGPAREALTSAKEYASLFLWLRAFQGRVPMQRESVANIAWGLFGQMVFIDAVSQ
jgi:RHS repeat-associated protein